MNRIFIIFVFLALNGLLISCLDKNISNHNSQKNNINVNYTSYFINSTIRTVNNKNFDTFISDSTKNYLILFTFKRCPICNKLITIFENVEKYYKSKENKNLKFAKIDSYAAPWINMRFDIFTLPLFVYFSNGRFSSFLPKDITEEELINYIESKEKDYKIIPGKIGYFGVFMKIFHRTTEKIKEKIPFWNEMFSLIAILVLFGSFIYFEYNLYKKSCCDNNNNTKEKEKFIGNNKEHNKIKKNKFKKE